MHGLTKLALGVAMLGGTTAMAYANTTAGPAGQGRYDAHRPCEFYLNHDVPAPRRCFRFFSNALGPDVYVRYGFVFRSHDSFVHYRDRGWFKDQGRLAAREDRSREHADVRAEQHEQRAEQHEQSAEQHEQRAEQHEKYAERDETSGGAGRGERAREENSGGASHGAMVYPKAESGGAGRGEHLREGSSGGASGY